MKLPYKTNCVVISIRLAKYNLILFTFTAPIRFEAIVKNIEVNDHEIAVNKAANSPM